MRNQSCGPKHHVSKARVQAISVPPCNKLEVAKAGVSRAALTKRKENKAQRHQWERPCQGEQGKASWKKMNLSKSGESGGSNTALSSHTYSLVNPMANIQI